MNLLFRPTRNAVLATLINRFHLDFTAILDDLIQSLWRPNRLLLIAILSVTLTPVSGAEPTNQEVVPQGSPSPLLWQVALGSYRQAGKNASAIKLLENMRNYLRSQGQSTSHQYALMSINLGSYLRELGDLDGAHRAFADAAAAVALSSSGPQSPVFINGLNHQNRLLLIKKQFAEAEAASLDLLAGATSAPGTDDSAKASVQETLARAQIGLGKYAEAEANLLGVINTKRRIAGELQASIGLSWLHLGDLYLELGRVAEAGATFARAWPAFGDVPEGDYLLKLEFLDGFMRLAIDRGNTYEARALATSIYNAELVVIRDFFPQLGESERLDFCQQLRSVSWCATIGDPEPIAAALLQTKAISLDLALKAAVISPLPMWELFPDLLQPETAARGMEVYTGPATARVDSQFAANSIGRERQAFVTPSPFAKSPALRTARAIEPLFEITPEQVCRALPKGTAVIEFLRYRHYLGRCKYELRYGALVIRTRQPGDQKPTDQLKWIPLGAAAPIDREIASVERDLREPLAAGLVSGRLRTLHDMIWSPIAQVLPAATATVFISPDSQICFLPFAALLDQEKRFLADRYILAYLSAARDLFRFGSTKGPGNRNFAIFAAPTYDHLVTATADTDTRFRDVDASGLISIQLTDLPGARSEAVELQSVAARHDFVPTVYLGDAASKQNVMALLQPNIIHFATHSFFLPQTVGLSPGDPMERSGLALTGAQVTLKAMAESRAPPDAANDGLLTAREVAGLQLAGTWIAALSACDTGRGETRDGEGVLGLRRGFVAAGAENLLLTLWKIPDRETVGFMREFYSQALQTHDPARALALTQRASLARLRDEKGIAAAVAAAGAFVLSTSGRVALPTATSLLWAVVLVTLVDLKALILMIADFSALVRRQQWLAVPLVLLLFLCTAALGTALPGLYNALRGIAGTPFAQLPIDLVTFDKLLSTALGTVGLWTLVTFARVIKGRGLVDQTVVRRKTRWLFSCQLLLLIGLAVAVALARPYVDYWYYAKYFIFFAGALIFYATWLMGLVYLLRNRCWKMIAAIVLMFGSIIALALLLGALATCLTDTAIQQYASLLFKTSLFLKAYWWVFLVAGGYSVFFSFRLVERKYGLTAATWMLNRFIAFHIIFVAVGVTAILAVQ
jgi:CHAT domain-containing protein/tetratricopeptide (TPR) repeat protein